MILEFLRKNLNKEFGVGSSTIYDIKKHHRNILEVSMKSDLSKLIEKQKILHNAKCVAVDKVLIEWVHQQWSENFLLESGNYIG